jgi:hypothetical protein
VKKIISTVHTLGAIFSLLFLCSCATKPRPSAIVAATDLPAEVSINKDAGCGNYLYATLRMEDGEEVPFMVDTGASGTALDKSWEPKLGKCLGIGTSAGWEGRGKIKAYAAPKLYLGDTRLVTGDKVWVGGANILGMDCLQHYCLQLDFVAGKMRFLKPDQVNAAELGQAYPLTFRGNVPFIHHAGLLGGADTNLMIDLGCRTDGLAGEDAIHGLAQFLPDDVWGGETYSNLALAAVGHANVLGLRFFARHLVTLDFPKRMLYLKPTSVNPLADDGAMNAGHEEMEVPVKFLETLQRNGQLPGLSKNNGATIYLEAYSDFGAQPANHRSVTYTRTYFTSRHQSVTVGFWKKDSSICHYTVVRASTDGAWKLQKAWRTDQNNKTIEEFPVR